MTKNKNKKNILRLTVDLSVYPLEAVLGACYVFIDRVYIFLEKKTGNRIKVIFRSKPDSSVALADLAGEFSNELLNYALRIGLARENKKIREYLVEQALFGAAGQESSFSQSGLGHSFEDDPLGIAVPWEEKYGKSGK